MAEIQKREPQPFIGFLMVCGVGLFLMICYGVCSPGPTPEQKAKDVETSKQFDAYVYAHEFVKKKLPAPTTADFPAQQEAIIVKSNENMYYVEGYFDAQNRYGAKVRWKYHCMVHLERGQAEGSDVVVEEP